MIASGSGFGDLEENLKGLTFLYHFLALTIDDCNLKEIED
jgi:hypothetical protein